MNHVDRNRPALATLYAVGLIGLIAAATTAAALLLRNDVRRTATIRTDAQLRQLLLAGTTVVVTESQNWTENNTTKESTWQITLPSALHLHGDAVSVRFQKAPPGTLKLYMIATSDDRQAAEDLLFQRAGDHWKLADIQLGPVSSVPSHGK